MKLVFLAPLMVAVGFLGADAWAESPEKCQFQGAWIGLDAVTGNAFSLADIHGSSSAYGTATNDAVFDLAFLNLFFPGTVDTTPFKGAWRRTGGRSFETASVSLAIDASRNVIGIAKMTGLSTLNEACDGMTITRRLELFGPDENPFADTPFFSTNLLSHEAIRMTPP